MATNQTAQLKTITQSNSLIAWTFYPQDLLMKVQWDENKKNPKNGSGKTRPQKCNKMKKKKKTKWRKMATKGEGNMNPNGRNFLCWGAYGMASHGMLIAWFPWRWGCYSRLWIPHNVMTSGLRTREGIVIEKRGQGKLTPTLGSW